MHYLKKSDLRQEVFNNTENTDCAYSTYTKVCKKLSVYRFCTLWLTAYWEQLLSTLGVKWGYLIVCKFCIL